MFPFANHEFHTYFENWTDYDLEVLVREKTVLFVGEYGSGVCVLTIKKIQKN